MLLVAACGGAEPQPDFVARVGDAYLTREELDDALAALPARPDSAEAARQIIDQWISSELLYQEANARGLRREADVERLLEESERSVLVSALISRLYEESEITPSPAELEAYFERHKEQLRLLEPFVRVRYLATRGREEAEQGRRALLQARAEAADSVWLRLAEELAVDPEGALSLASNYYPESRIFAGNAQLRAMLGGLRSGDTAPVLEGDTLFHVLQLVERVPAGTIPRPEWIEDELNRRLLIQARKQMYARQVQRLRNEALAQGHLEIQ